MADEHFDVLVVGAGLSGVGAACHLETDCPWASYAILEARHAIGGTWDLFRYPGVRSDSDMFTLGYPFRPWASPRAIVDGASIRRYIEETAAEHGVERHIRFGHRVVRAEWSGPEARWLVTAERSDGGGTVELSCGFLFCCTGYYRYEHGHEPDFADRERYAGQVIHPQAWPEDLDVAGKQVVVIGSGSTAVTLVPALAATAGHVTMIQRSPTYIASVPSVSPIGRALRRVLPARQTGVVLRWLNALLTQGFYQFCRRRPELARRMLERGVTRQLPAGYDVAKHFRPRYEPWDERLCAVPDGDLFRCIRKGTVSVVTDHIDRFTEGGLRLASGEELAADVVVTATGLDLLFLGGTELVVDGERVDPTQRLVYKGMMLEGVPNLAMAVGYTNASWTLKCDLTCEYVCRLLEHLRATGLRQCTALNDDPTLERQSLLGLSSGYVRRSEHLFPKQGSRPPWRVYQSYLRDYRALKRSPVVDGTMVFSNPLRAPARAA